MDYSQYQDLTIRRLEPGTLEIVMGEEGAKLSTATDRGFSIPASMARRIDTELVAKGKVTRGWLGVSIPPLTPELAKSFGLREAKGVLISDVVQDSAAGQGRAGDHEARQDAQDH